MHVSLTQIAWCAGYLVYLFKDDERKVRIEGP
jgi:hypothetical protein